MVRHLGISLAVLFLGTITAPSVSAELVTYTFDAPQFTRGQTTPLLNRAPNSGLSTFRTDFTSGPTSGGFVVEIFQPNILFSGQMLYDPIPVPDVLTLTFNLPVDHVQFAFAVETPGRLVLTTPVMSVSQNSMVVGGPFQGGTFVFNSPTAFTTLQLEAFTTSGARGLFALDNLSVNAVPEPTTVTLLGIGILGLLGYGWRRRKQPA